MLVLTVAVGAPLAGSPPPVAPSRPDVFLFTVDTVRADALSAYGAERRTSPWLNQVAAAGVRFDHCVAPSSWTVPTVSTVLTGLYPWQLGVSGAPNLTIDSEGIEVPVLPSDVPTLAERMRAAGYATVGVTANLHLTAERGYGRGFDLYRNVGFSGASTVRAEIREAVRALPEHQPRFVWVHLFEPHEPYAAFPASWLDRAAPDIEELSKMLMEELEGDERLQVDGARQAKLRALYDAGVLESDIRLFEISRDLGVDEHDVLIYASDHGEEFFEHGALGHRNALFEETVRVPLIIRAPSLDAGVVSETVSLVDLPATILDLAGVGARLGVGRSMAACGKAKRGRCGGSPVLSELVQPDGWRALAIYRGPYKLIRTPEDTVVFHLQDDPAETKPLADPVLEASMLHELDAALRDFEAREPKLYLFRPGAEQLEMLEAMGYVEDSKDQKL